MTWLDYYKQGLIDIEIAALTHYHKSTICRKRKALGLPINKKTDYNFWHWYRQGLADLAIAVRAGVNPRTVFRWRHRNGLKANYGKRRAC